MLKNRIMTSILYLMLLLSILWIPVNKLLYDKYHANVIDRLSLIINTTNINIQIKYLDHIIAYTRNQNLLEGNTSVITNSPLNNISIWQNRLSFLRTSMVNSITSIDRIEKQQYLHNKEKLVYDIEMKQLELNNIILKLNPPYKLYIHPYIFLNLIWAIFSILYVGMYAYILINSIFYKHDTN